MRSRQISTELDTATAVRAAESRFLDARLWGAPAIAEHTLLAAPFGWTGLIRAMARDVAALLRDSEMQVSALILDTRGIVVDLTAPDMDARALVLSLAQEFGRAAMNVNPETGLLKSNSLQHLLRYESSESERGLYPKEFASLLDALLNGTEPRTDIIAELAGLRSNIRPSLDAAPSLRNWMLAFPRGFTEVAIVGETGPSCRITEPVLALDRFGRWARTTRCLYSLQRGRRGTWNGGRRE